MDAANRNNSYQPDKTANKEDSPYFAVQVPSLVHADMAAASSPDSTSLTTPVTWGSAYNKSD